MKLAINLTLSLGMLAACFYWVWPAPEDANAIVALFRAMDVSEFAPYLLGSFALMAVNHFCRAWRWNNLLAPLGVRLPPARLMAVSSVGFMAILAFPARLGEFVRPALIRDGGRVSASAALGTVAVERIVDGLLVSIVVFAAFFAARGPGAPGWMMPTAYIALGVFAAALVFLVLALRQPRKTIAFCVAMTLLPRLAPRVATTLADKLFHMITGFLVLRDRRNLFIFVLWSIAYWTANGLSLWVLARGFGMELSIVGAFAVMGIIAVGITLPNAPALAGQFHGFAVLGLSVYFSQDYANTVGLAFATVLHLVQVVWYIGAGAVALTTKHVSISEVMASRRVPLEESEAVRAFRQSQELAAPQNRPDNQGN